MICYLNTEIMIRKNIIITGGSGRFGSLLKKRKFKNFLYPNKKQLNILNLKSIEKYLRRKKAKMLIHLAGLSRPLEMHEKKIEKSITLNIIGTCNVVLICKKLNIKLVYFSTNYVYPGLKGNYKETDPLLPLNNYAWSKLGGEAAVHMYKNSLILRVCMTEKPFVHKYALKDVYLNFIFQDEIINFLPKILNKKGIINVGGKIRTVYNFAKKFNPKVKKISYKKIKSVNYKKYMSMNVNKLQKLIKS